MPTIERLTSLDSLRSIVAPGALAAVTLMARLVGYPSIDKGKMVSAKIGAKA